MRTTMRTLMLLAAVLAACLAAAPVPGVAAPARQQRQRMAARRAGYTAEAEADRVTSLPGAPGPHDFGLFAGYVTVSEAAGRSLFYVFAEAAAGAPADAPLVLWLNGGPGCSSLGGGFMSELGPWYPKADGQTLQANTYSWNKLANVLWLESPAFVGFSYSNTSSDALVGDARTAADARRFLLGWLERFPRYKSHELYLAGESYGGHYVPGLAWEIVTGNVAAQQAAAAAAAASGGTEPSDSASSSSSSSSPGFINLKGMFVGNAWTDAAIDNKGALDFWYSHAMIGDESYARISRHCDFRVIGPLARGADAVSLPGLHDGGGAAHSGSSEASPSHDAEACARWLDVAFAEQGNINIYEIYADVCVPQPTPSSSSSSAKYLGALLGDARTPVAPPGAGASGLAGGGGGRPPRRPRYDPCIDGEVETFLNLPEVQAALHANQTVKLPWRWTDCTRRIQYSRADLLSSMLPVYRQLLTTGLRIWVFSGDVDGIVPVLGSRRWVASLNLPVAAPWRPWTSSTGQVGGWRVDYQGLTFATVRNAGHMVPYVQPERTYTLLSQFLYGKAPAPLLEAQAQL